jgi:hypothetical protein
MAFRRPGSTFAEGYTMKKSLLTLLCSVSLIMSATMVSAKEDRPYTDGPVTDVSFVKSKPGKFDEYMKWIATVWKQTNEEAKKAGILTDYRAYAIEARHPGDPDIILTVTYPNMAALDNLNDKYDAITEKVEGSVEKSNANAIDRESLREVLGSELIREMVIK